MDTQQQRHTFEQLANKAKRAGLLRYNAHGILVIVAPPDAPAPAAQPGPPAAPPAEASAPPGSV